MVFKQILNACVDLIYPPVCLHCGLSLRVDQHLLCTCCLDLLEFLDFKLHCPKCFSLGFCSKKHICAKCSSKKSSLTAIAATFDYKGPSLTMIKNFKYGDKPYLSEGIAGFMAAQFVALKWPLPDIIVPVPISFSHWFTRGYNQAELLSKNLSLILQCEVQELLHRKSDDYSQASLNHNQRMKLTGKSIQLKKNKNCQDKIILLIDDVLTTGSTLQRCAESLLEGCPSSIYALTACHAIAKN